MATMAPIHAPVSVEVQQRRADGTTYTETLTLRRGSGGAVFIIGEDGRKLCGPLPPCDELVEAVASLTGTA